MSSADKSKTPKPIPFDFVLEQLARVNPLVNPMFGCHAVYVGEKIVLVLRKRPNDKYDNGVWLATTPAHHESLKKDFPSMRSIRIFGKGETGWQVIPSDADDFEESVMKVCALILKQDARIGKIPNKKKKKNDG
jgi:hypothetical protein